MNASTNAHHPEIASARSRFWPVGLLFVLVPVLVGQIPGALAFTLNPGVATDLGMTRIPIPVWVFIVVWLVIKTGMGLAAWQLWRRAPRGSDVTVPLTVLIAGYLQTNLFWLADGLRSIAVTDATGLLLAVATVVVFSRYSPAAARWLLPWLIWMPITLAVKIAAIVGAFPA
ncbi:MULTISPECIES: tryptophan-rich sensory protein [unclassified Nonomuraea]|uniref:tryptophan-rich sensory protein n=1 Tax=unclassified Nonomuraea TaxID=2593643 RepID=UPI0035C25E99